MLSHLKCISKFKEIDFAKNIKNNLDKIILNVSSLNKGVHFLFEILIQFLLI